MTRLLAPIIDCQQTLEEFIRVCPEESSPYFPHIYAFLRRNMQRFHTMMAPFGHDETLDWIITSYRERMSTLFTMIFVHLQVLSPERAGIPYTQEQQAYIDELDRHIERINQVMSEVFNAPSPFYASYAPPKPADQLLSLICEFALHEETIYRHIRVIIPPNLPRIAHHPGHILAVMHWVIGHLASAVWRQAGGPFSATIAVQAEDSSLAILITASRVRMTLAVWEALLTRHPFERLYEIGGSLMPLTWDEGLGQGVIVRLPWAAS